MCVIAVSRKGVRQPTTAQFRRMWARNHDGAGYMFARDGQVHIRKGFMTLDDFLQAVQEEQFTAKDSVVYHFRIATQAGVNPEMTHPFPLSSMASELTALDVNCPIGMAHNGVIRLTSCGAQLSDTALYIGLYMPVLIRSREDLYDEFALKLIEETTHSKWALMDGETGSVVTVGNFINDRGLLFSNYSYGG